MRVLACDPGTKRLGFAISDEEGRMAVRAWHEDAGDDPAGAILAAVREAGLSAVCLGLPLRMEGGESMASVWVRGLAADLEEAGVSVEFVDERLTTPRGAAPGERDAAAARTILETALARRR